MSTTFLHDSTSIVSSLDLSVNFVSPTADGGMIEARYVRREPEYFIVYLSSHSGCAMACRQCHLTATGQTMMHPASLDEFTDQAARVLEHYDEVTMTGKEDRAGRVNFNWMARGEPLANPAVVGAFPELTRRLGEMAAARGLESNFNVSTILPREAAALDLAAALRSDAGTVLLYYSLYSLDPAFRRRWLPKAMPGEQGLDLLAEYQARTGAPLALHWAFIKGENDDEATVRQIAEAVRARGLRAKFNLVRYNPYSAVHGEEPAEPVLERNFRILSEVMQAEGSRIVPRIGFDVKASCGMFVEGAGARGRFVRHAREAVAG